MIFNQPEIRTLFHEMRNVDFAKKYSEAIDVSQPGLFMGNGVLFIGQNPGYLKPDRVPSDAILSDKNTSDEVFHEAYKQSQMSWKFYDFIKLLIDNSLDFSIINPCFFPTTGNQIPSCELIEACSPYFLKAIDLINPKVIVCLSSVAKIELKAHEIDKKYKVVYSYHYAYLYRQSKEFVDAEIKKIKDALK